MADRDGPVLIELDDDKTVRPDEADPVPEPMATGAEAAAMQRLAGLASRPANPLVRWFWSLLVIVVGFFVSLTMWSWVDALLLSSPLLGTVAAVLVGAFVLVCLVLILREVAAFSRLSRLDKLQHAAVKATANGDLAGARTIVTGLSKFYASRPELRWGREVVNERMADSFDADGTLALAEKHLVAPLDAQATREIEAASRQVATITALVPLALVDVITALTANLRMMRRIAEIYGGRSGTLGTWRLMRAVLTHLVATGAVAVGDDLIGSFAGGSLLGKVSRRFGEGVVNGALTARVGVAAMEVCRPLPFASEARPSVSGLLKRALAGLFSSESGSADVQEPGQETR